MPGPMHLTRQQDSTGAWTWLLPDGLGSVRGVVNINNMPLDARMFTPYVLFRDIVTRGKSETS